MMVSLTIKGMSNCGAFITWSAANAAAKALINKYLGVIGDIDIDSYRCRRKVYFAESICNFETVNLLFQRDNTI